MGNPPSTRLPLRDFSPRVDLRSDFLEGLSAVPKTLPCKYFYDARGSRLFDEICELEEYYLTRTEIAILEASIAEIAAAIGPDALLVEYGSGSSVKIRLLLDHVPRIAAYVPVDISREHLLGSAESLTELYPELDVYPVCADFTQEIDLPRPRRPARRTVVYFPGSTIGNFPPEEALTLLRRFAKLTGSGGGLLIGTDLEKDPAIIERAYNDARGVTAEFNLNLLRRANRELGADFRLDRFEHWARYVAAAGRVEIALVSKEDQVVRVAGRDFSLTAGEKILTEVSYKYDATEFDRLAASAGFVAKERWTDPRALFAVSFHEGSG